MMVIISPPNKKWYGKAWLEKSIRFYKKNDDVSKVLLRLRAPPTPCILSLPNEALFCIQKGGIFCIQSRETNLTSFEFELEIFYGFEKNTGNNQLDILITLDML